MEMSLTKSFTQSITIKYQSWKYSTTLSKTVTVDSAEELLTESDKLWRQARALTEDDMRKDEPAREKLLQEFLDNNVIS